MVNEKIRRSKLYNRSAFQPCSHLATAELCDRSVHLYNNCHATFISGGSVSRGDCICQRGHGRRFRARGAGEADEPEGVEDAGDHERHARQEQRARLAGRGPAHSDCCVHGRAGDSATAADAGSASHAAVSVDSAASADSPGCSVVCAADDAEWFAADHRPVRGTAQLGPVRHSPELGAQHDAHEHRAVVYAADQRPVVGTGQLREERPDPVAQLSGSL